MTKYPYVWIYSAGVGLATVVEDKFRADLIASGVTVAGHIVMMNYIYPSE